MNLEYFTDLSHFFRAFLHPAFHPHKDYSYMISAGITAFIHVKSQKYTGNIWAGVLIDAGENIFNAYQLETASIQNAQTPNSVILSGASAESKDDKGIHYAFCLSCRVKPISIYFFIKNFIYP